MCIPSSLRTLLVAALAVVSVHAQAADPGFQVEISGNYQIEINDGGVQKIQTRQLSNNAFISLMGKSPSEYRVILTASGAFLLVPRPPLLASTVGVLDIGAGGTVFNDPTDTQSFAGSVADLVTGDPGAPTRFDDFTGTVRCSLKTVGGIQFVPRKGTILGVGFSAVGDVTVFTIKFESGRPTTY